jgi:D-glycero-D-manno-heptose 1,7-bisphosphate phosphatase
VGIGEVTARAVFLDRDGVLNKAVVRDGRPYPPSSLAELELLPGVEAALHRLRAEGCRLVVVTNQPDVARGAQSQKTVELMHAWLRERLPLDDIRVCYHDDRDDCSCRKPRPGLLLDAARDHHIDLTRSFMVGDRWRDVEAGRRAGCRTVLVDCCYDEPLPNPPDARVASLSQAVDWIVGHLSQERQRG